MSPQIAAPGRISPEPPSVQKMKKRKHLELDEASEHDVLPTTKKIKAIASGESDVNQVLHLTPSAMAKLSKDNLIKHYRVLQQLYNDMAQSSEGLTVDGSSSSQKSLSKQDRNKKIAVQADAAHKGIKKQMKWQMRRMSMS